VTVPASLTPTCQKLYDNVAGARFVLDTPDFPDFSAAIKASILDEENGWCAQVLKKKADEFGKPDPQMTYLRITLGTNQGESPGIPFVMEIWPSGNYSPVHNHGGSDAVIRVLHGEITVSLYAFLAPEQTVPFATKTFVKEDVTWISPRLNQVHKLHNLNPGRALHHHPMLPLFREQRHALALLRLYRQRRHRAFRPEFGLRFPHLQGDHEEGMGGAVRLIPPLHLQGRGTARSAVEGLFLTP
jgi:hypothetical protein